ncbi:heme oxygenase (biliverdin-producing) [Corynebacterium freiburgense]|uniref:biliverdin-producing heme oxygenase n=1 Tax=Corynebacterium freiburgense TaxID=556548 RepID=UPI0003F69486|nr:biliverdin-producing heme oxygenase [Corynebacterium freiburgense]WJZ03226.1 Heme oxygenase [Corynebacterium freiburgense]
MTLAMEARPGAQLSAELKTSTAEAHERAEHSTFMEQLLNGNADVADFIALQEQSWFVYSALENAARKVADNPIAAGVVDPVLDRVPSLEADLDHLHGGKEWRETVTALPATQAYVDRLNEIAETSDAARLVAHHYVRYLGDLSGGQVIGRMMQRHYDVAPEGVTFYNFEGIEKVKPYKDNYRAALDAIELSDADRARLLDEAGDAFLMNLEMFNNIGATR